VYQLRTAYLAQIRDGVGERLINVNASVLNNPAFRAAGWVPAAAEIKRTYSPPIPTAITSEYFQAPRSAGLKAPESFEDDEEVGGMVTGGGASNDTVGPRLNAKRRRRKEQLEEDDSSDLSDESDDDTEARPANQIQFTKMQVRAGRGRAGSSPIRGSALRSELTDNGEGPSVMVTSPSKPPDGRLRRGSLGTVETIKERARRDTVTSSDMSSENELDFQKKRVNPHRAAKANHLLQERIQEDEREQQLDALDEGNESDSSLSSEFSGSADSASLLGDPDDLASTPPNDLPHIRTMTSFANASPKKPKLQTPTLQALPPPRPISFLPPISALTQALKAKEQKPTNPLQRFAALSATSEAQVNPIYIRIYCPWSSKPSKPFELLLKKYDEKGEAVTVSEAIGFALWRYQEEKVEPPLTPEQSNVNCWVLRMYDDGEIDDEFPPLTRNKPIMDFASNNSRGMRPRARDKPWDEFGLVEATEREVAENEKITPVYSKEVAAALASQKSTSDDDDEESHLNPQPSTMAARAKSFRNPITGPSFAPTATRKNTSTLADAPVGPTTHAASRMGAPKIVTVQYTDENFNSRRVAVDCTTDTYIAEIFDKACRDLHLDKALFVLKVSGSTTVAPSDRTVEALGSRMALDLVRRRFVGDGVFGLAGSPGSSSPNAPLVITSGVAPSKKTMKKAEKIAGGVGGNVHPLLKHDSSALTLTTSSPYYRRYPVLRKQPMSFSSSSSRILALDNEYMHIMPGETTATSQFKPHHLPLTTNNHGGNDGNGNAGGKTTTVHYSSIVGSKVSKKHARMFRVIVFKERETKRYDFEARSKEEAGEIVREIRRGVEGVAA
jgi:hypothetical protein